MIPLLALVLLGPARAAEVVQAWPLDTSDAGFVSTTEGGGPGQWEWGVVSSGPQWGFDGPTAWATELERDYLNNGRDRLGLPPFSLDGLARPVLSFQHWYEVDSDGDAGTVEVLVNGDWEEIEPVYGYPSTDGYKGEGTVWSTAWFDLTGVDDTSSVHLLFTSDEFTALSGWYVDDFVVWDGDPVPPLITDPVDPGDIQDLAGPYPVSVHVEDDVGLVDVAALWRADEGPTWRVTMAPVGDGRWQAELPAVEPDTVVSWSVEATDGSNPIASPERSFRVYLAAPTGLVGPEGRIVGTEVELDWAAPDAVYLVTGYRIYRDGEVVAEADTPPALAPLAGPIDTFEVTAVYDTPLGEREGDPSGPLSLEVAVPEVDTFAPASAWQGDRLRVTVAGTSLLLDAGDADLDLGEGVEVVEVDVEDVDHATFTVEVEADAPTGARPAVLGSGGVEIALPDFQVLDGADRPALVSVEPSAVHQGDEVTLSIAANAAFAGDRPVVDLGEGIVVQSAVISGDVAQVAVVVSATAPIGLREVTVDDGVRVVGGVELRVRDRSGPPEAVCGCASVRPGAAWPWLLAASLVWARRRPPRYGR